MGKGRLEAFSDGVFAIIITIMVLEMKDPHGAELGALREVAPMFLSYVLSFLYLGIYWCNHHHLLYATHRVNGAILWANLHLLFWLSLVPFVTRWMGDNHFAPAPTMVYGVILLLAGIAYWLLQRTILLQEGPRSMLAVAIGTDWKVKLSLLSYGIAIPVALLRPWIAGALYVVVVLLWLVPDRRIERKVSLAGQEDGTRHTSVGHGDTAAG
ncbi:MAG TPA: TMEM175 family protein [Gemmatimonadales bacterium]|nr:TMEM175 family protein [Gemmatimonadales bacterium]